MRYYDHNVTNSIPFLPRVVQHNIRFWWIVLQLASTPILNLHHKAWIWSFSSARYSLLWAGAQRAYLFEKPIFSVGAALVSEFVVTRLPFALCWLSLVLLAFASLCLSNLHSYSPISSPFPYFPLFFMLPLIDQYSAFSKTAHTVTLMGWQSPAGIGSRNLQHRPLSFPVSTSIMTTCVLCGLWQ